jgi:hypothetical protein
MHRHLRASLALATLCGAVFAAPAPVPAADNPPDDKGNYNISLRGRAIGVETFSFTWMGDTLLVESSSHQQIPDASGGLELVKRSATFMHAADYGLRSYLSNQIFRGDTLVRGLEPTETDTVLSVMQEFRGAGQLSRKPTPAGRIFVLDSPPLFSTFDLIGRTLHGKPADRSINLYVLADHDTAVVATVREVGYEPLRWGARPVTARKLEIVDGNTQFIVWMSPRGRMLRFEQPSNGLVVERDAGPVKPAARRGG